MTYLEIENFIEKTVVISVIHVISYPYLNYQALNNCFLFQDSGEI